MVDGPKKPQLARVPVGGQNGAGAPSGYCPFCNNAFSAKFMMGGPLAKAKSFVVLFRLSSSGCPGNSVSPPHEGIWQASNGEGMMPWNKPAPARTTKCQGPPRL